MKNYIIWGIVGIIIFFVIYIIFDLNYKLISYKLRIIWEEKYKEKKKKKEEKANKRILKKFSKVYIGNPYLETILKQYNIIVYGRLGAGKTLFANLLCHYLNEKYIKEDKKNRRYIHYMMPDYEMDLNKLKQQKLNRVYSSISLTDNKNNNSQELWPYLTQKKRFIEKGIIFTDEFGTSLGKDLWFSQDKNSIEVERIVDMSRYARQNCDIKWIGTEQSRDNIFKPIRDRGFTEVEALKTFVELSLWGKFKKFLINIWKFLMPGYLTINVKKLFEKTLFRTEKIKIIFKLFLPTYFLLPREYYISKTNFSNKLKKKHTKYSILINFYGHEMMFKFNNKKIFKYNTRQNKSNYLKQFDKEGNRIYA